MYDNAKAARVRTLVVAHSGELVPVESCDVQFCRDRCIQGVIEFYVDGIRILGHEDVDTIDALWSLMLTSLKTFIGGEDVVINFPECRYMLVLKRISGGRVVVKFVDRDEERVASGRIRNVLEALTRGAVDFFEAALNTLPVDEWTYRRDFNAAVRLHEESAYFDLDDSRGGPEPKRSPLKRASRDDVAQL